MYLPAQGSSVLCRVCIRVLPLSGYGRPREPPGDLYSAFEVGNCMPTLCPRSPLRPLLPLSFLGVCLSRLLGKCNLSQATFNYCDAVF